MIDIGTGIILIDYQYGQTAGYCQINPVPGILAEGATWFRTSAGANAHLGLALTILM
jgi:hypothetical protein